MPSFSLVERQSQLDLFTPHKTRGERLQRIVDAFKPYYTRIIAPTQHGCCSRFPIFELKINFQGLLVDFYNNLYIKIVKYQPFLTVFSFQKEKLPLL